MKTILKDMKESGEEAEGAEVKRKGPLTLGDFC